MNLEDEVKKIKERNARVEGDKSWETSTTRRVIIFVATYFVIVLWLYLIEAPNPWFNAFVPAVAFVLSTLTMPLIKGWWIKNRYRNK